MFVLSALSLSATAAGGFCNAEGRFVQELRGAINPGNAEASGLTYNAAKTHFFTVSDSPKLDPRIFVTRKDGTNVRTTIKITGIRNTGFNGGYGDWEGIASYPCRSNAGWCILIGDFGHNKVRGKGGVLRQANQSTRFIEVPEPSSADLNSGRELVIQGKEYAFSYPDGQQFDAEAMVVKNRVLYVITKNSRSDPYSRMFQVPSLSTTMTLVQRAKFRVSVSEVTDAASSPSFLILRTYVGLNFYKWDDLCGSDAMASKVYQEIPYLSRNHGIQEAVEYDDATQTVYLVGEKDSTLFHMKCGTLPQTELQPAFGSQCSTSSSSCFNVQAAMAFAAFMMLFQYS